QPGADQLGSFIGAPEPDERAEREREEDAIRRLDARRLVHRTPATGPPPPALVRIQPAQRFALRAGRLMDTGVAVAREGQVGAVRWVSDLIGGQLFLGGERQ